MGSTCNVKFRLSTRKRIAWRPRTTDPPPRAVSLHSVARACARVCFLCPGLEFCAAMALASTAVFPMDSKWFVPSEA